MSPSTDHLTRIRASYPDIEVQIRETFSGRFNDVSIVNGTTIVRFPRYGSIAATLPRETILLRALRPLISLAIPQPIDSSAHQQASGAFLSYPMIEGSPLWRETAESLDDFTLDVVIGQLVTFLDQLHSLPASTIAPDLPNLDGRSRWVDTYADAKRHLFPHISCESRLTLTRKLETFLDSPHSFEYEPAIRHGDPGPGNVLFDATSGRISGIVDFDFAGPGDPALDWSIVLAPCLYGDQFVRRLERLHPVQGPVLARARFYRAMWPVKEALRAMETGEKQAFEREVAIIGTEQSRRWNGTGDSD